MLNHIFTDWATIKSKEENDIMITYSQRGFLLTLSYACKFLNIILKFLAIPVSILIPFTFSIYSTRFDYWHTDDFVAPCSTYFRYPYAVKRIPKTHVHIPSLLFRGSRKILRHFSSTYGNCHVHDWFCILRMWCELRIRSAACLWTAGHHKVRNSCKFSLFPWRCTLFTCSYLKYKSNRLRWLYFLITLL